MCKLIEDLCEDASNKAEQNLIRLLIQAGRLTLEEIAHDLHLPLEEVQRLAQEQ